MNPNRSSKSFRRFVSYLPIILLGIGGSVVVFDMWHTTGMGRKKVTVVKNEPDAGGTASPSASGESAASTP
jgi:hypothetical protein